MSDYVDLFAYGSIQPGAWNWPLLETAVDQEACRVGYARGDIRFVDPGAGAAYPVAWFAEGHEFTLAPAIWGTVMPVLASSRGWTATVAMELNSGYFLKTITVTLPDKTVKQCLAFEFRYDKAGRTRVPDGDWLAWYRASQNAA